MKISVIKKWLLDEIVQLSELKSFKVSYKDFSLTSKNKDRELKFYFTYNSWADEIHLFPIVSIDLFDIIEVAKINNYSFNKTAFMNLFVLKKYLNNEITEDTVWQMQLNDEDRISVTNLDCINKAKSLIESLFVNYGKLYFNEYSSIEKIDEMYNTYPTDEYNPNCSGMNIHCIIGLISAKLSGNKDYTNLSDIYSEIVSKKNFHVHDKDAFFRIRKYLG